MEKKSKKLFKCEECDLKFKSLQSLSVHIGLYHYKDKRIYYDKWLKTKKEGSCVICGKPTKFESIKYGYKNCCSIKCKNIYAHIQSKQACNKKYKVDYPLQSKEIQETMKKTVQSKYQCDYYVQSKEYKKEMMLRYNVESTLQSTELFNKGFKKRIQSGLKIKNFRDTNLTYQGSYELDFLEKFYDKIDIKNGASVPYLFEGKNKVYHSDFYIPSKNLIIEIKNSYLYERDKSKIKAKEKAIVSNDFKYMIIIDKNYSNFLNLV
jgi:hypothetical protein